MTFWTGPNSTGCAPSARIIVRLRPVPVGDDPDAVFQLAEPAALNHFARPAEQGIGALVEHKLVEHNTEYIPALPRSFLKPLRG